MNKGIAMAVLGVVLALAALIVGCGGDSGRGGGGGGAGGGSTVSKAPLTKAEFIRQGDSICQVANEASQSEIEEFAKNKGFGSQEPSKAQFEEVVTEVLVPNLERQAAELDALPPPPKDKGKIKAIVASLREATSEMQKNPSSFEGNVLAKPIRLENAYGFKVCGGG